MRRERVKQSFKLRLLALVLALALLWYSLNPAPPTLGPIKRDDELPDEKKREVEPGIKSAPVFPSLRRMPGAIPWEEPVSKRDEDDDFEWPEFIDA